MKNLKASLSNSQFLNRNMYKTSFEKNIEIFLKQNFRFEKPLLLGFSGGTDSLVLAHCFMQLNVPFHIAHFDHGWRETSAKESGQLKKWAEGNGIPFYCEQSQDKEKKESSARKERYRFFETLFQTNAFEALVLAHHLDDQAETVLKRVLEGAHLSNLRGMEPITKRGNMPIWRPLLSTSKKTILHYIQIHQLSPIEDETNHDPKYLRARMRASIFPKLAEEFGKEVIPPLFSIGNQARDLHEYLNAQIQKYPPVEGPFGKMWDFASAHPVEIEHLLMQSFSLSRSILIQIIGALQKNAANHSVRFEKHLFIVDRKKFFWIQKNPPFFTEKMPLQERLVEAGSWQWKVQLTEEEGLAAQNWLHWWKGKISLPLFEGTYFLAPASSHFRKKWNTSKVPAFLRSSLPIVLKGQEPVFEFLTEKKSSKSPLLVTIEIIPRP